MGPGMKECVEALYATLPATDYDEIRRGMTRLAGRVITLGGVNNTLHYIRTHPDECGFNVSYVKRGVARDSDENRYFIVNKDDRSFSFSPEHREHFDNGCHSTILTVETLSTNLAEMLEAAKTHERLSVHRDYLGDMQEVIVFLARRMARLRTVMAEKQAA
jgi:hypothetical protein